MDTYDTLEGVRRAAVVGRELAVSGHRLRGVRLDSGDLEALSHGARAILDEAGLADAMVFASGALDEREIARLLGAGAPIGGFGVGTKLGVSADAPFLDMAYKLVEVGGRPVLKLSPGKASLPGRKQVWRARGEGDEAHDVLGLDGESGEGRPLLREVMRDGRTIWPDSLAAMRERARVERESLPVEVRDLDAARYDVRVGEELAALRESLAVQARP